MVTSRAPRPKQDKSLDPTPRLSRVRLDSVERVRRELARIYVEAREGRRDVQDASRLANMLSLLARMIEGASFEERLAAVERAQAGEPS
jgi:hypothetical protein